jgi:hypothetical protein
MGFPVLGNGLPTQVGRHSVENDVYVYKYRLAVPLHGTPSQLQGIPFHERVAPVSVSLARKLLLPT